MKTGTLNQDARLGFSFQAPVVFPAGTACHYVDRGGTPGWVISSESLVAKLTNPHDAKYRYVWVPAEYVKETAP